MKTKLAVLGFILMLLMFLMVFSEVEVNTVSAYLEPPPNGLNAGVGAFQTVARDSSTVYYDNQTGYFPRTGTDGTKFAWGSQPANPFNPEIEVDNGKDTGHVQINVGKPVPETDIPNVDINYWILTSISADGTKHYTEIAGTVQAWTFWVQVYIEPDTHDVTDPFDGATTSATWLYQNTIWINFGTTSYNMGFAYDPSNPSVPAQAGWSVPLSAYLEIVDPTGGSALGGSGSTGWYKNNKQNTFVPSPSTVSDCTQYSPQTTGGGAQLPLYSSPTNPASITQIWYTGEDYSTINSTLAGSLDPRPDTHLQNNVWTPFTVDKMRANYEETLLGPLGPWLINARDFPCVVLKLRVFYLTFGQFLYEQKGNEVPTPTFQGWQQVFTPFGTFMNGFFSALGWLNPFNIFGSYAGFVAFLFLLLVIAIIIFVLLAIFAPWVLPRIFGGVRSSAKALRGK